MGGGAFQRHVCVVFLAFQTSREEDELPATMFNRPVKSKNGQRRECEREPGEERSDQSDAGEGTCGSGAEHPRL